MKINYIYILDLEYLSWSLKSAQNIFFRKKSQPPEIIQLGLIKLSLKNFKSINHLNLYVQPKINDIPKRITNLTGITKKLILSKGITFDKAITKTFKFLDKKSIIICNGSDDKILKINFKINKINLNFYKKKILFYDFSKILKKLNPLIKTNTDKLTKLFNLKLKIKPHNAINDCRIIIEVLKKIKKDVGKNSLTIEIMDNLKKFN